MRTPGRLSGGGKFSLGMDLIQFLPLAVPVLERKQKDRAYNTNEEVRKGKILKEEKRCNFSLEK